jgi:3-methylfumaryl-CoA hydratase
VLALEEEHDIVYRGLSSGAAAPVAPPTGAEIAKTITPDPTLLFRYSALTFNGHRIHYDQPYATKVEGYPGLVFHGPLTATLLMALAEELGRAKLARFSFRGVAPLFDTAPFAIKAKRDGDKIAAWAETPDGALAMSAEATLTRP